MTTSCITAEPSGVKRLVIGLTGGIGSGKSTVGAAFERLGVGVVDADAIAHSLTAPGGAAIPAITETFGPAFIRPDGAMDRDRMRAHVFSAPAARATLEAILHPMIRVETTRQVVGTRSAYCMLMVPLLVEAARRDPAWRDRFDRILVADCSEATQIARVMSRNGFDEAAVRRIMAAQATRAERLARADDVIDNDGDLAALVPQVERLHGQFLRMAAGGANVAR